MSPTVSLELFQVIIGYLADTPEDKRCPVKEEQLRELLQLGASMGRKNCNTGTINGYETEVNFANITFRHYHNEVISWN